MNLIRAIPLKGKRPGIGILVVFGNTYDFDGGGGLEDHGVIATVKGFVSLVLERSQGSVGQRGGTYGLSCLENDQEAEKDISARLLDHSAATT